MHLLKTSNMGCASEKADTRRKFRRMALELEPACQTIVWNSTPYDFHAECTALSMTY